MNSLTCIILTVLLFKSCFTAKLESVNYEKPPAVKEVDIDFIPINIIETNENTSEGANFWDQVGLKQLKKFIQLEKKFNASSYRQKAKNIIIFIGDGMGVSTITAGRIYKGQKVNHNNGEEEMLTFDTFPYTGLAKTYNVDMQVPDSAGTATAILSGVKTNYGTIGLDISRSKTDPSKGKLTTIMDWAQTERKRTGIVTTTSITDATPAAAYAHVYDRLYECDTRIPKHLRGYLKDIAAQLIENSPGNKFNVIMGGGRSSMGAPNLNENETVAFEGNSNYECKRSDNRDLVKEWLKLQNAENNITKDSERIFVESREELLNLTYENVDYLMGLFRNNHLSYAIAREEGEPTLKEMTEAAIKVLERGNQSNGFVLLVEGGRIDHAHHQNYARAALQEVIEFDKAVEAALALTNPEETLILVTADHSHAVTLNGYPKRGEDILGFDKNPAVPVLYETITYANGPGYYEHLSNNTSSPFIWRLLENYTESERRSPTYRHMAATPLTYETHGGEDVAVFAQGPGSSLIHGVFEQNYLAYVMSYAGCMGPAKDFDETCQQIKSSASTKHAKHNIFFIFIFPIFFIVL